MLHYTTLIIFFACLTFHVHAQHRGIISILDIDSRNPVNVVVIIQGNDTIAHSTPQGLVIIPTVKGKILFTHRDYKSVEYDYDSIPSVVKMKCIVQGLNEVVILGRMPKKTKIKHDGVKIGESHFGIVKTTVEGSSINIETLRRKLFGKTRKEKKKDKLRKVLEEYEFISPANSDEQRSH